MYQTEDPSSKSKPRVGEGSHDAEHWSNSGVKMYFTGANVK